MKVLDPIFNFVQDHLLLVLSPLILFVVVVVPTVLILQFLYDQKRITNALARKLRHLGLEAVPDGLRGPDLSLVFQWSRIDTADVLHVQCSATLPKKMARLSLSREGYKSGLAARKGVQEVSTGGGDFDDYFWIPSGDVEVLTPERRALLLDVFPQLPADAEIVGGRLSCRVRCEQSPFGVNAVVRTVEQFERLRSEILDPPVLDSVRPRGWVRREKCRQASIPFWLFGMPLVLASLAMLWNGVNPWISVIGFLFPGALLVSTASALSAGRKIALPLARSVQVLVSLALLAMAPLALMADTLLGGFFVAGAALGAIYALHLGYAYLTRLRLS